ncbi:MAG: hypothetical protein ACOCSK_00800 [Rhodothermales bacterium]
MSRPTNVVRIDTYNTHGWQVRITRHRNRHTKFFSDARYGDSDGALLAAQEYRDEMLKELPAPLPGTRIAAEARSTSGVPGVRLNVETNGARIEADAVIDGGQRRVKTFSLRRWGLRKALWNACKWKANSVDGAASVDTVNEMYNKAYPNVIKQLKKTTKLYKKLESEGVL